MANWRAFLLRHARLALALVVIALVTKAVIPAGFMLMPRDGAIAIVACSGQGPEMVGMAMAKPGDLQKQHPGEGKAPDHPCAFSSLAMAAVTGADIALLALALVYVLALGILPVVCRPWRWPTRLRPPLRAPPLSA
ncbi:hypothetical protein [Sphingomonas sp. PAMC 26605]|uniref:hypothetical protein n=1 Tax=Sphingomonas sp. PAMC 26605 TaxID=1112214 RepID=UPI00026CD0E9|nr:hypothetical protein [Sphingomonas sp. PAMC 26605]